MRAFFLIPALLALAGNSWAKSDKVEWQETTLTDKTIKKIQQAQFQYKKCIAEELQKPVYQNRDSRNATDALIKQCEPILSQVRNVYLEQNIPGPVADRHLKQLRIHYTRQALQELMFRQASRQSGGQ
jgi:hypothetical protein